MGGEEVHDVPAVHLPRAWYVAAFGLAGLVCWALPIHNPLSRDEAGTYWIVKDSLSDVVSRSYYWTNWSPYYLVEWVAVRLGGAHEIVMRLPSVAAMALAAFLLFRIGARLWDEEAGLLAALVFAVMPDVGFAAGDARPYAFTLVALAAYTLAVLRWIDRGRFLDALAAALLAALTAYGHAVLSLGLVVPACYAAWSRPRSWHLAAAAAVAALLAIPLAVQLRAYLAMSTTHFAGFRPVLDDLWAAVASAQFLATVGAGLLLAYLTVPGLQLRWVLSRPAAAFLAAWAAFAPAVLFALARTDTAQLFLGRYLLSTAIPQALLYGALIRAAAPSRARAIVATTVVAVSAVAFFASAKSFHGEGWRDAMAAVRAQVGGGDAPLVWTSPFIEAQTGRDLDDPRLKDVLFAPRFFYPVRARIVPLPYRYDERYLDEVAASTLEGERAFVVLTPNDAVADRLTRQLADRSATSTLVGVFRGLRVYRFELNVNGR